METISNTNSQTTVGLGSTAMLGSVVGPPLKRLRRYGFKVGYYQRQQMRQAAQVCGAIPTECDPEREQIKVSHLFVARDGKTYVGHEWISAGGSSYSWSEPYTA